MTRQIVSVPDGTELSEALAEAVRGLDGWVQGAGFVDGAELRVAGDGADPVRRVSGRHAIAALAGPAGGPYGVVLVRDGAGPVAGHLVRAQGVGVMLFVTASGPVANSAEALAAAPEAAAPEAAAPGPAPAAPAPASAWAAIATATVAEATRGRVEPAPIPKIVRGDRVLHFAFGLCDVVSVRGDRLHIRDLSGPGRIRELAVDKLEIQAPYEKDNKRVFRLSRKQ